ncbi:MAG: RtcB family protein [Candidatus Omnitrophica bacterium]|nr:RtcB family protein [Candidatus Omnitrophota bacterium]
MNEEWQGPLEKIDDYRWRLPKSYKSGMRVDGLIYADEKLLKDIRKDKSLDQVANVAFLPGIQKYSIAMPDMHWGYGFCIGGVCATDPEEGGVISPGGVGFDINCGVRLLRTRLTQQEVLPKQRELVAQLFRDVPCGLGVGGQIKFSQADERKILTQGSSYMVKQGFGRPEDILCTEADGCMEGADPSAVSERAYERGKGQVGTLGSGNHFIEVQLVDQVYDPSLAQFFGLEKDQVTVMIHSGSRGLGYQVCEDSLRKMAGCPQKYKIALPDRQLVCAPLDSPEGEVYLSAMRAAANYAWANRQVLTHLVRQAFVHLFRRGENDLGLDLIYDVAHNIAKMETYEVKGKKKKLCVHRKGATRAFPPGHPELPERYRSIGQPVLIPGDMGRNSYLLVGQQGAMEETFGSSCHGAGRIMSRGQAVRISRGRSIQKELEAKGIIAMARGRGGLDEEQPEAYKDVNEVVRVVGKAGISKMVVRMRPIGVIKG